jgi:hypothetical protein
MNLDENRSTIDIPWTPFRSNDEALHEHRVTRFNYFNFDKFGRMRFSGARKKKGVINRVVFEGVVTLLGRRGSCRPNNPFYLAPGGVEEHVVEEMTITSNADHFADPTSTNFRPLHSCPNLPLALISPLSS